jgi:hypothetical protein
MHTAGNIFTNLHVKQASGLAGSAVKSLVSAAGHLAPAVRGAGAEFLAPASKLLSMRNVTPMAAATKAIAAPAAGMGKMTLNMGAQKGLLDRIGTFAKAHPMGTGLGIGLGSMEALNRSYRLPNAQRDGAWQGGQAVINQTAARMANAGFGERLGMLLNPQGAGQQYQQMALEQLRQAMGNR